MELDSGAWSLLLNFFYILDYQASYSRECQNIQNIADLSWHEIFRYLVCTDEKTIFIFEIVIEKWPAQSC